MRTFVLCFYACVMLSLSCSGQDSGASPLLATNDAKQDAKGSTPANPSQSEPSSTQVHSNQVPPGQPHTSDEAPKKSAAQPEKKAAPKKAAEAPGSYVVEICPIYPSNNAKQIEKSIGTPKPFSVSARDDRTLLIYYSKPTVPKSQQALLDKILSDIRRLATPPTFTEELEVTNYSSLGDLQVKAKALNFPGITVDSAGDNKIRVTRDTSVTQEEYEQFKDDLSAMGSRLTPTAPTSRLYYITADDAAKALGGGSAKTDKGGASAGSSDTASPSDTPAKDDKKKADTKGDNKKADTNANKKAAGSDNKQNGSGQSDSAGDSTQSKVNDKGSVTQPQDDGAAKKGGVTISTLPPDLLVFGVDHPGDDAEIVEKKRILAVLDFPRPEVFINTFSFQTSTSDPKVLTQNSQRLQTAVGRFNDSIQFALDRTWRYLQGQIARSFSSKSQFEYGTNQPGPDEYEFFDLDFLKYLRLRFVADGRVPAPEPSSSHDRTTKPEQRNLSLSKGQRGPLGLCAPDQYCLGYTTLFKPLRPSITEMLLAVISSNNPAREMHDALDELENIHSITEIEGQINQASADKNFKTCESKCGNVPAKFSQFLPCDQKDDLILRTLAYLLQKETQGQKILPDLDPRILPLYCFREEIDSLLPVNPPNNAAAHVLRATLANFLFQYKMSLEYPHDFSSYELTQSAQALNSQLNPLIVAFNRDLAAALRPLEDVASGCGVYQCNEKNGVWFWQGHDTTFVDNGIITVRTVSGKPTSVDAVTQSFFDATEPPSLTDLISSIGQAESNTPKALKANLTANEAAVLIGALNSVKPAVAQVGREFKIDITPHSLSGASSAELELQLTTQDQGDPTRYSNGKSDPDNLSRVAKMTTSTKVRLESIKLFEISSLSATLQRSRKNIPIILPGFELPYIGSIVSFPVAGAKQYHRSTAVMSAVVVPTAADLATSLEFTRDRVLHPSRRELQPNLCTSDLQDVSCVARPAMSLDDLNANISEFNRRKVQCVGMGNCVPFTFHDLLSQ